MVLYPAGLGGDEVGGVTEGAVDVATVAGRDVTLGQVDGAARAQERRVVLLEQNSCCTSQQFTAQTHNLNTSDSWLHHTISLMYIGARHFGFGIT